MVTRGYPSISFLHAAAQSIAWEGKPAVLYYYGDRDPSGVDIPRFVEDSIRDLAPDVDLTFDLVAVTEGQITEMQLPTRPTKRTDTRSKNFHGESVEVDAIPPDQLKKLCEDCITQHIDDDRLEAMRIVEDAERTTLGSIRFQLSEDHE